MEIVMKWVENTPNIFMDFNGCLILDIYFNGCCRA